ncbi:ATP-binding cassette domain-containing protein, partial [Salmonella enterica]|nr:ATP-binding cassette domain-containing protein [Salmonella enterica]
ALVCAQARSLALSQRQEAGGVVISEAKNLIMTLCSAMSVLSGDMTMGMMLATQYIAGRLVAPVQSLTRFAYAVQDVRISLERILSLNLMPDEDDDRDASPADVDLSQGIELSGVTYSYSSPDGEDPAVADVSLSIPAGKVTAIVGSSGSGKTTLVKLLLGFFHPQKGQIVVGGADLSSLPMDWWRSRCGTVMQDGVVFSDSVAHNIATADATPDPDKVRHAAQMACADEFITTMPAAYATKIGAEGQQLSKGQKQRILIARAIYSDHALLIMDEATNSLDTVTEARIVHNLNDFCVGRTTVVIAHRLSTVRDADQIIVMDRGRIVEQGDHDSLTACRGYYYKLIENQLNIDD